MFRHVTEDKEWGSVFVKITGSEGLAPGATSESQTVNSLLGYTGTETRQQMLENSQFVDAKVAGLRQVRLDAMAAGRRVSPCHASFIAK